jgi:hypothetical protein
MPMQKASLYSSDPRLTINPLCGERIERPREAADAMQFRDLRSDEHTENRRRKRVSR